MSGRRRTPIAACLLLLVAAGCSTAEGQAFVVPDGQAMSSLTTTVGEVVLFSPFPLQGTGMATNVTLKGVSVEGDAVDDKVGSVELAGYYDPATGGLIGTARGSDALAAAKSRLLPSGQELNVADSPPNLAFLVAVRGRALGNWRADYVNVSYTVDGHEEIQHIKYGLGVCVVKTLDEPCDAGLPPWWGK